MNGYIPYKEVLQTLSDLIQDNDDQLHIAYITSLTLLKLAAPINDNWEICSKYDITTNFKDYSHLLTELTKHTESILTNENLDHKSLDQIRGNNKKTCSLTSFLTDRRNDSIEILTYIDQVSSLTNLLYFTLNSNNINNQYYRRQLTSFIDTIVAINITLIDTYKGVTK